ncbi:MAG: MBL fold metallo-hydrolase, partial [Gemmatimonadetes bacterium]|nr:ribonuclease Z [Gemmatimonadota bacterium]NIQ59187.1 ribonuclease Z [Gemmatimonadota bacterium]NIU79380.1 MBL fold metallo-hydrolase [Gammaproteobacteria bacterium]NIX48049.1 MBL fold metallo-hydrolase [Gemmatimonadota bacterium]NIY12424.1 MBL fold metallo-hydrolase [Gemmatimonadota bacterium]
MRLTVVGSGTAAPEAERVCAGFLVESAATRALFDCGPGVVHHLARFRLPWRELDHVFLSHFHNDHTGDLPMLLFALKWGVPGGRRSPLTLWGPAGVRQRLEAMAAAYGEHVVEPGFPLSIRTLEPGGAVRAGALEVATVA